MQLTISVIVPSYNGAHKLERTLSALMSQSAKEIIIVIDGSTDSSLEVVKGFEKRLPGLITLVRKNGGRSVARNEGARVATSDILLFIDDDIEILPTNVNEHLVFHTKYNQSVLVGSPRFPEKLNNDVFLCFRRDAERSWLARFNTGLHQVTFDDYVFTSSNLSLPKKLFFEAGMFDERLTDSEDFDLSVRLLKSSYSIFFDPTLICYNHDFADLTATLKRQSQYYHSKLKLIELHPDYVTLLPVQHEWLNRSFADVIKRLLCTNPVTESFIRSSKLMQLLPQRVRDNLYASFIYCKTVLPVKRLYYSSKFTI